MVGSFYRSVTVFVQICVVYIARSMQHQGKAY